jgi:nitrite reductase (NADH) large subunit
VARRDELKPARWWTDRGVTLIYGCAAVAIDPAAACASPSGATLPYAKLVLATGSRPIRLPVPGMDLPGVLTFRDLADVSAIEKAANARAGGGDRRRPARARSRLRPRAPARR